MACRNSSDNASTAKFTAAAICLLASTASGEAASLGSFSTRGLSSSSSRPARAGRDDDDERSPPDTEPSDSATPDAVLASKQIAAAVNFAVEALSEELRQAITLREIEGLSYEEIAALMNCPIGTVRSRIFRAREAIAARLRPLLDTREGDRW